MFLVNIIALLVTIAGAVNLGLVGFFNYNFISMIFGGPVGGVYTTLTRVIFAIIGLGGIWSLSFLTRPGAFTSNGFGGRNKK